MGKKNEDWDDDPWEVFEDDEWYDDYDTRQILPRDMWIPTTRRRKPN